MLRYEELALDPNSTTHKLLKFLRLSSTQSIDEFLHSHTNMEVGGVSSTYRVSRDVPFRWKNVLDFNYVDEIQVCAIINKYLFHLFQDFVAVLYCRCYMDDSSQVQDSKWCTNEWFKLLYQDHEFDMIILSL